MRLCRRQHIRDDQLVVMMRSERVGPSNKGRYLHQLSIKSRHTEISVWVLLRACQWWHFYYSVAAEDRPRDSIMPDMKADIALWVSKHCSRPRYYAFDFKIPLTAVVAYPWTKSGIVLSPSVRAFQLGSNLILIISVPLCATLGSEFPSHVPSWTYSLPFHVHCNHTPKTRKTEATGQTVAYRGEWQNCSYPKTPHVTRFRLTFEVSETHTTVDVHPEFMRVVTWVGLYWPKHLFWRNVKVLPDEKHHGQSIQWTKVHNKKGTSDDFGLWIPIVQKQNHPKGVTLYRSMRRDLN